MSNDLHWQAKLAAWIHDPAEKALVLLRDPAGHEGGTVRALEKALFPDGIPDDMKKWRRQADHWASAADRPQFPMEQGGGRYQQWTQVRFDQQPVLIHPLSGQQYTLNKLGDISLDDLKKASLDHFQGLILSDKGAVDWRKTALAFWRFGPELDNSQIGKLWSLLPADTRIPDHTIWTHLDLSAAFCTAFTLDSDRQPALLAMSFGPVQDFIAQARSTSDLWAGSHLLSRLAWEGLKVVCERLGPDAVLFPQLRGVPLVDLWLQQNMELPAKWFEDLEWRTSGTDANPLFAAALPNRFVALVPADQAQSLAEAVTTRVRDWVHKEARAMLRQLLDEVRIKDADASLPCWTQLTEQLAGFPEVHWATVPWSLVSQQADGPPDTSELAEAQAPFFPDNNSSFLASHTWALLKRDIEIEGAKFYKPNPGVLYPAIYELLDRLAAAAKAIRPFSQMQQHGYRDSLSGEMEWLTTDRAQLDTPPGSRSKETLWNKVAGQFGIRQGEHLSALGMIKRLWPRQFVREIESVLDDRIDRYVVSTHTLALTTTLERWLQQSSRPALPVGLAGKLEAHQPVALPRKLARILRNESRDANHLLRRLPSYLDFLRETEGLEQELLDAESHIKALFGAKPEAYYALIMLDGDKMGAWLSGSGTDGECYRRPYQNFWHPEIHNKVKGKFSGSGLDAYLNERRAISPARHIAISAALNAFSLHLARHVVEDVCKGKLIYSGGDDVLAMVSVDDLLPALLLLRLVYSGLSTEGWERLSLPTLQLRSGGGHVRYDDRLYRVMGQWATASAGAVVAHHTAPLDMVLRQLRQAEKRAKNKGGRDAFAITLLKRSGGAVELTCPWQLLDKAHNSCSLDVTPMGLLLRLRDAFAGSMSRRAAYHIQSWIEQLPGPEQFDKAEAQTTYQNLLIDNLRYQFQRQGGIGERGEQTATMAEALGKLAGTMQPAESRQNQDANLSAAFIRDFLAVAEFLAREGRTGKNQEGNRDD